MKKDVAVKELEVGVPILFTDISDTEKIHCGRVLENNKISCLPHDNKVFDGDQVKLLDFYEGEDPEKVMVYPLKILVSTILPSLKDDDVLTFISSSIGRNFAVSFQHIFDTKALVSGYYAEDETGDIRLFNCSQSDLQNQPVLQKEVVQQLDDMIGRVDIHYMGFVFVKSWNTPEADRMVVELCPECGTENAISNWNIKRDGMLAYCPRCGSLMALCSECEYNCDWSFREQTCSVIKHELEARKKKQCENNAEECR